MYSAAIILVQPGEQHNISIAIILNYFCVDSCSQILESDNSTAVGFDERMLLHSEVSAAFLRVFYVNLLLNWTSLVFSAIYGTPTPIYNLFSSMSIITVAFCPVDNLHVCTY